MFVKIEICPICDNTKFKNILVAQDHLVTKDSFAITECNSCQLRITSPRPINKDLYKYYQSDNYISHTDKGNNLINLIYKFVRNITLRQKYQLVNKRVKDKTILDFGCGTGDFLNYCKNKGWQVTGVENNEYARSKAIGKINSDIYQTLPDSHKKKYSAITLWHVLEHVPDINQLIESLKSILDKKGRIFVAVPNCNSYDAHYYKQYWAAYDLPRHLYHFTPHTMKLLMKKHKLKVKETIPMYFDSFYVSMLSEKYKSGKNNYKSAFKTGFKSNKMAAKNKQYSSLIYVIKK
ncbi:MAG: class I SAM-dependent methyltransferase [Spirochaetota bacterium]